MELTPKERARVWYLNNKEKHIKGCIKRHKEWTAEIRKSNPKELMLRRIKNSAISRKLECTISTNDFEIPAVCPILLIPLVMHEGNPGRDSPSLDRLDNNKGYIPGNVEVISFAANRMKSTMSREDIKRLYNYVFKTQT